MATVTPPTDLPILAALPELESQLRTYQRVVLEAPPGAGKSTYLPLWLLGLGAGPQRRVVLIQPRRIAADAVARYLARQSGRPLGELVGLRTRFDHKVSKDTVIEVVTEGIFLRQIQRDPLLDGVGYVLFDEYHERSWQADLGLAFALESQQTRDADDPLHLLVMSATLPSTAVAAWLDAPLVSAEGRRFPVAVGYAPAGRRDALDHLAAEIEAAVGQGAGKVLVFLAGWQAMQRLQQRLTGRVDCDVHLLHSQVRPEEQQAAMTALPQGRPVVVLATNIAETSLTIDGVDTVIDSGQVRRPYYDGKRGMDRLETGWISKASAEQRAGRAGRLGPGRCIRLWSQDQQGRLLPHDPAEIQQVDLAPLALELALWGAPIGSELLPEPAPAQRLAEARQLLARLGALDGRGGITAAGRRMAEFGVHPRLGRLILAGQQRGEAEAACLLAALLSEGDFLRRDNGPPAVDIDWRLGLLAQRNGPGASGGAHRIRQLATQLLRRVGDGRDGHPAEAGPLLLVAFPDRVARQRQAGSPRYLCADGFEVVLEQADALIKAPWLVVAEHDGARQGARVRLAAAVAAGDVEAGLGEQIETVESAGWDESREAMVGRRQRRLGAIVLEERAATLPAEQALPAWLEQIRQRGLGWLQWTEPVLAWLERVRWLASQRADWPDFSETALLAELEQWLAPYLGGMRRLAELRQLDFLSLLQHRLDYALQQQLERLAPARYALPSGSAHRIDYGAEGGPKLAARLQEFYGLDHHPAIADGAQPLLLELLSPAQRPVQVTRDLPGFWRGSYPEVRKEMKGRYPKHFWPDQPWSAVATTATKKRAGLQD